MEKIFYMVADGDGEYFIDAALKQASTDWPMGGTTQFSNLQHSPPALNSRPQLYQPGQHTLTDASACLFLETLEEDFLIDDDMIPYLCST